MSILGKLTEGVVHRDMKKEGAALLNKWEQTGLLEGLEGDVTKNNMARLLENQAKQLLKEAASQMATGDVEGFAAVAFPIVRRVFGGLIANELVSVQPMSLPSGLIFFLDFTFGGTENDDNRLGFTDGTSLYGQGRVGSQITGGANLEGTVGTAAGQFYNLVNGYSSPTGSNATLSITIEASGTVNDGGGADLGAGDAADADAVSAMLRYDPDLASGSAFVVFNITTSDLAQFNPDNLVGINLELTANSASLGDGQTGQDGVVLRRLYDYTSTAKTTIRGVLAATGSETVADLETRVTGATHEVSFPEADDFTTGGALGSVEGRATWALENETEIPEINLQVDSVSVTAITKKLKAKWTPELGQDLNAYHNLDAEVELTSILSEQIALEIDREILEDLVKGATAATYYWSRSPGLFVDKATGAEVGAGAAAPDFTGTVSEWYETLLETINDVSAQIHRKTLRGGANFIVTSPEVASILEMTSGFRANVTVDQPKGTAGPQQVGSLNKRLDVHVDPYFPRNLVLVGRRGGSFLESGYVYAPYVPLQVTPTIFGIEDFVPRKGVMTRYAKKMVRPDMYGLVISRGLLGESGATSA